MKLCARLEHKFQILRIESIHDGIGPRRKTPGFCDTVSAQAAGHELAEARTGHIGFVMSNTLMVIYWQKIHTDVDRNRRL